MSDMGHSAAPRPGGGFNPGMGQFGEHIDEAAMMKAMQAKGLQQQQASASTVPTPQPSHQQAPSPPSDMGSFTDELFVKPAQDFVKGIKDLASLDTWLNIKPSPEQEQERARKEVMLKRFNKMTDEEQEIFKLKYQERIKKQQMEEEEKNRKKQIEMQQQQSLNMPHKAQSGPVGPGMSGSQKAKAQLDWDRQRQDSTASAG